MKIEKAELARTKLGCLSFVVHIFLLILLLPVMYSNFSSYDYLLNENTKRMFGFTPKTAYQNFSHSWSEVANTKQFYEFFEMIMRQVQYPRSSSVVMVDNSSIILGVPRLHQYRISSSSACVEGVKAACISEESIQYDTSSYAPGWRSKPPNVPFFEDPWAYIRGKEVATDDGYLRNYPPDGYFVQLGPTLATSLSVLDYLERNHWIDNRTRGVFYEIAMYNIHLNRFIHTRLVLEVSAGESWQTSVYSCPLVALSPTPLLTDELFVYLMIAATALIVFLQVVKVLVQVLLYQEEKTFLILELILLAFTTMTAYVVYKHIQVETQFLANVEILGNDYHISLDEACYWDLMQQIMCGITFSYGTILLWRFLYVTRPQFYILIVCLRTIAWLVVCQAVLFCLYLLAFAVMGHLVFGHHIFEFKTLAVSFINLFQESTRYYSIFSQVKDYNYVWGNVFEIMFTPFLAFVLLNIFVGLVSFGCSEARRIALERQRWMSCFTVFKRSVVSSYQQPHQKCTLSASFHPTRIKALEVSVASFLQYCVNLPEFQRHVHLHQTANSLILGTEQAWKSTNSVSKLFRQRNMVERRISVMKLVTLIVLHLSMTEPKDSVKLRLLLHSVRSQIIGLRLLLTEIKITKLNNTVLELNRMLNAFKLRYLRLQ